MAHGNVHAGIPYRHSFLGSVRFGLFISILTAKFPVLVSYYFLQLTRQNNFHCAYGALVCYLKCLKYTQQTVRRLLLSYAYSFVDSCMYSGLYFIKKTVDTMFCKFLVLVSYNIYGKYLIIRYQNRELSAGTL